MMRDALYGADNPTYTGQMVWRALLKAENVPPEALEPHGHTQWIGSGRHFIAYYIRGGRFVNVVTQQDTDEWVEEGWSIQATPKKCARASPTQSRGLPSCLVS